MKRKSGFGTLASQLYSCDACPVPPAPNWNAAPRAREAPTCPAFAQCDGAAIGRRTFAVSDRKVAKIFGDDEAGLEAEAYAYGTLGVIENCTPEFVALKAEKVTPTGPRFHPAHLLVDRYTPMRDVGAEDKRGAWSLARQLQIMHKHGVAHGNVSDESVGALIAPWSVWNTIFGTERPRFVLGMPRGITASPFSSMGEASSDELESDVVGIVHTMLGGRTGPIVVDGPVASLLVRVPDWKMGTAVRHAESAIARHNEVVASMARDRARMLRMLGTEGMPASLVAFLTDEPKAVHLENAKAAERKASLAKAGRARVVAAAADAAVGCALCGDFIAAGKQAFVFAHRNQKDKVVKVYLDAANAQRDARAFGVLSRISARDPKFRSLRAELVVDGDRSVLVVDRFKSPLGAYVNDDGSIAPADGVTAWHFGDLLRQFGIMHSHGVAHGDAHSGNSGLVVGADGARFVIGDPTSLTVSPLSWLGDGPPGTVLGLLRAEAARRGLGDPMNDVDASAPGAEKFLAAHRSVVAEQADDRERVRHTMRGICPCAS
jgi:hypothetical protein